MIRDMGERGGQGPRHDGWRQEEVEEGFSCSGWVELGDLKSLKRLLSRFSQPA